MRDKYVSLIGVNGLDAFEFEIRSEGRASWGASLLWGRTADAPDPKVAAGEYLVVPGTCSLSSSIHKVLRLLAAGRRADLEAAGVPLITTSAAAPIVTTISATDVIARIDGIAE